VFIIFAAGLVLYFYVGGDDSSTTVKKPVAKTAKSSSNGSNNYIPLDSSIHLVDLTASPKDAFLPLVSKSTVGGGDLGGPINIPLSLTGGEEWAYTGMVQVNGQEQAVLENSKSSDTAFVTVGQQWKKAKVKRISDSAVELADENGRVYVVKMSEATAKSEVASAAPADASANAPLSPTPTGAIGQVDVSALPGVMYTPGAGGNGGGGFGRRRRGNFGGGGLGGG
jgi:hypothetical protein